MKKDYNSSVNLSLSTYFVQNINSWCDVVVQDNEEEN